MSEMPQQDHTATEILRAAAAWVWFPRDSDQVKGSLQLVRWPARFGGGVQGSQVRSEHDASAVVDEAVERTLAWGESRLTIWVSPSERPDLEDELRRRGAAHDDTVSVLARPLTGSPVEVPAGITAEVVETAAQVRDVDLVNVPVWQQEPLDEKGVAEELAELTEQREAGTGARVLARQDGQPVSTGGCTIVDGFVRLWGAATLPQARGRGAYRAVLAERMRIGAELGARTALVKGRITTSAPILERNGFQVFGEERSYVLTLG